MSVTHSWGSQAPNTLSAARLLLVPALLAFALLERPTLFLACFLAALLTDALDGFLARRYHLESAAGARLDSWADALAWLAFIPGTVRLWPGIWREEAPWMATAVTAFLLPGLLGLIRYHKLPGLHTWSAKLAMICMGASVLMLFGGMTAWPFRISVLILAAAGAEEILIISWFPSPPSNLRSARQAWRLKRSGEPPRP